MKSTKRQLPAAQTDTDKNYYRNRRNAIVRQVDKLVCQLYDLTDDDVKIVEGNIDIPKELD